MKLNPTNLKIEILGTLPQMDLGEVLTPQQIITLSSYMTYKDVNAKNMALEILESEGGIKELDKKTGESLMNSARRGHASLSTSAYVAVLFMGASKFVDSLFTGAIFASSLMPSGRRVPVDVESIVAPNSILNADIETQKIYHETSKNNILLYEKLVDKGISKQDASKITQYGVRGGGFMVLPLETIISFKKEFENQGEWIPDEGNEFVDQLEDRLEEMGMDKLYWARNFAPRNTIPYPNIFTNPKKPSFVNDLVKENIFGDINVNLDYLKETKNFEKELSRLYGLQQEITKNSNSVKERWQELLGLRRDIISRYKNVLSVSSLTNTSWRVWGEVKRHRTLPQQPESVYAAVERGVKVFRRKDEEIYPDVFMTPQSILNGGYREEWFKCVLDSFDTFDELVKRGIKEKDAIGVIPRGLKFHIQKQFDLYNLIDGYAPLRSCGTVEPEMKRTTEIEISKVKNLVPEYLGRLMGPKCSLVGFCLEPYSSYEGCQKINNHIGFDYTKGDHNDIHKAHKKLIMDKLD